MMKVIVNGACGHMGREVLRLVSEHSRDADLAFACDRVGGALPPITDFSGDADVIVDFSNHSATKMLCDYAVKRGIPTVIATTGQNEDELSCIRASAMHIPVFLSGNMSLGIALLVELAKRAATTMPDADIEIVESHHNRKEDSPSGTALMIADAIRDARGHGEYRLGRAGHEKRNEGEIGIHSVRAGGIVGIHEVVICTETQSITLKHEAYSRSLFAEGALEAARYICTVKEPGIYNMYDMLRGE